MIQFKRFQIKENETEKINKKINFPIKNLDLKKYLKKYEKNEKKINDFKYDLYAVCFHEGNINSGHYFSKILVGDDWYLFDDDFVCRVDEDSLINENSYLLFYRQNKKSKKQKNKNKKYKYKK